MSEFEIVNENEDHTQFKIKFRSNSFSSIETVPEKLPTIKVFGTGGTIASKGSLGAHQTAGYKVDLTIEELVKTIPDLSTTCDLVYEQLLNVDSKDIGEEELKIIYNKIKAELHMWDGFVICHGTDTAEETSCFLQCVIETEKPIVFCGSMRPSTAISADGPMNLYQAIQVASNKESWNRGILVTFNDRIISGFFLKKSNTNTLDTFNAIGQGYVGNFVNNQVCYYFPPSKPMGISTFPLPNDFKLPQVGVIFSHQGLNNDVVNLYIEQLKVSGLVFATMGAGSLNNSTNRRIFELSNKYNIPIIYSKRSMDGIVPIGSLPKFDDIKCDNIIAGGSLSPQKCRIYLQLCLINNLSMNEIRKRFKRVYGGC